MIARSIYYFLIATVVATLVASSVLAQPKGFNYDESKVPDFTQADPLTLENGDRVADADTWKNQHLAEIVDLFETHVYGRAPQDASHVRFGPAEVDDQALSGAAIRKQMKIYFSGAKDGPTADLIIYLPAKVKSSGAYLCGSELWWQSYAGQRPSNLAADFVDTRSRRRHGRRSSGD